MRKVLFLIAPLLYFGLTVNGQNFTIAWQNTIGGSSEDKLTTMDTTSDGGYILGGYSSSPVSSDVTEASVSTDFWVVKMAADGSVTWQNMINADNLDYLQSIHQTMDGGYIVGGTTDSDMGLDKSENTIGLHDYWVIKLDGSGDIVWENTIGGTGDDYLLEAIQTAEGGYMIGGWSASGISGDRTLPTQGLNDIWMLKLNAAGTISWQKNYGGSVQETVHDFFQTSDGGYVLGGSTNSPVSGDLWETTNGGNDFWVLKLNDLGTIQWARTIGGADDDGLNEIHETSDGGFITGGYSHSDISGDKTEDSRGFSDYWAVKLSSAGQVIWDKTIGGDDYESINSLKPTMDGGYILGGQSQSGISGDKTEATRGSWDYWVIKLDSMSDIEWQRTLGGSSWDYCKEIIQINSNSYLLAGYSASNISGEKMENSLGLEDFWMIEIECAPSTHTLTENACDSYISPSGNYTWLNSGIYTDILTNANGCDSIITINLTVDSVDVSVTQSGNLLQANAFGGANYQWVDCDNNFSTILTEVNQFFTATNNGNYAVIIWQNGCIDTSTCYSVTSIGMNESYELPGNIQLYPNPTEGTFTLDLGDVKKAVSVEITNAMGQLIYSRLLATERSILLHLNQPAGVYFVRIISCERTTVIKLIRE